MKKYTEEDIKKAFLAGANLRFFGSVNILKEYEDYLVKIKSKNLEN